MCLHVELSCLMVTDLSVSQVFFFNVYIFCICTKGEEIISLLEMHLKAHMIFFIFPKS